jgi:hypothetical protein
MLRQPARANRSDSVNAELTIASLVDVDVVLIRHLPEQPEPGRRDHRTPQQ